MVYVLFDNPADKRNMEFLKKYGTVSFDLIFPSEQCRSVKSMMKVCYKYIQKSNTGDTIVCWYDFMGILCWWLCEILHKKRKIVALNILLKNKETLKNKVARFLYRQALKSANLNATVPPVPPASDPGSCAGSEYFCRSCSHLGFIIHSAPSSVHQPMLTVVSKLVAGLVPDTQAA